MARLLVFVVALVLSAGSAQAGRRVVSDRSAELFVRSGTVFHMKLTDSLQLTECNGSTFALSRNWRHYGATKSYKVPFGNFEVTRCEWPEPMPNPHAPACFLTVNQKITKSLDANTDYPLVVSKVGLGEYPNGSGVFLISFQDGSVISEMECAHLEIFAGDFTIDQLQDALGSQVRF